MGYSFCARMRWFFSGFCRFLNSNAKKRLKSGLFWILVKINCFTKVLCLKKVVPLNGKFKEVWQLKKTELLK